MASQAEYFEDPHVAPVPSLSGCYAIFWAIFAVVTILFVTRLVSRWRIHSRFRDEDYVVLFAYLLLLAGGIMDTITLPNSFKIRSLRTGEFPVQELGDPLSWLQTIQSYAQMQFAMKILYYTCLWTVKLSFLLFLKKMLFALPGYGKYWWTATLIWGLTFIGCILSAFTACPSNGAFSTAVLTCSTPKDTDANTKGILYAVVANVVTDIIIIILPYPLLSMLRHLTFKQKIGLYGIFSLCAVTIAACIIRAVNILKGRGGWFDPVWVRVWNNIECLTAVAIATIPGIVSAARKSYPASSLAPSLEGEERNGISPPQLQVKIQPPEIQEHPRKPGPAVDWWTSALRRPSLRPDDEELGYQEQHQK